MSDFTQSMIRTNCVRLPFCDYPTNLRIIQAKGRKIKSSRTLTPFAHAKMKAAYGHIVHVTDAATID